MLQFKGNSYNGTQVTIEITVNNNLGFINTFLLQAYANFDHRIASLGKLVKLWAKRKHV